MRGTWWLKGLDGSAFDSSASLGGGGRLVLKKRVPSAIRSAEGLISRLETCLENKSRRCVRWWKAHQARVAVHHDILAAEVLDFGRVRQLSKEGPLEHQLGGCHLPLV